MEYTLKELLEVQKKVDAGITKHHGTYRPRWAALAEVIEMLDHLALIGTWKKGEVNEKQAFMELVDVFAFTMSAMNKELPYILDKKCFEDVPDFVSYGKKLELVTCIDGLLYGLVTRDYDQAFSYIATICKNFFKRPLQEIFYYYMGKQELTKFRQKNGYKEGTYNKMWLAMEDNEHLTKMLEQGIEIELLPKALADGYGVAITHA
jgi:hypothetical protein